MKTNNNEVAKELTMKNLKTISEHSFYQHVVEMYYHPRETEDDDLYVFLVFKQKDVPNYEEYENFVSDIDALVNPDGINGYYNVVFQAIYSTKVDEIEMDVVKYGA